MEQRVRKGMEQLTLFAETGQSKNLPADMLEYIPGFIDPATSDQLLTQFICETPWKQTTQKLWDKEYLTPRLTCWYGDAKRVNGILPWTTELQNIRQMAEAKSVSPSTASCLTTTTTAT